MPELLSRRAQTGGGVKGSGTASSLMWETVRIIEEMGDRRPRVVIWENVKGVLAKKMRPTFNEYLSAMEALGYTNSFEVLNARDFGLPQNRERVFTVSMLGDEKFDFSTMERTPMHPLKDYLETDFEPCHIIQSASLLKRVERKVENFNGFIPCLNERNYACTVTTKQDRAPNSGVIRLDHPELLDERFRPYIVRQRYILDAIGGKGVARTDVINDSGRTITTRQDHRPAQVLEVTKGIYRFLTERECWRLMGFTDEDFDNALKANPVKAGCMNRTLYKQAGNSMPVPILESIFKALGVTEWTTTKAQPCEPAL